MGIVYEVEDFDTSQVDYSLPLDSFSDDEIGMSLVELWADVKAIDRQVADHRSGEDVRSSEWVHRALRAKGFKLQNVDRFRAEAQRRGLPEPLPEYAQQIAIRQDFNKKKASEAARIQAEREARQLPHHLLMKQQREDADRRRAEREAMHRITMDAETQRSVGKAELFVRAAKHVLTKEQRQAIWLKAEALFPGHSCFAERAPAPQDQGV